MLKVKKADIIFYMLTSLVSLKQGNVDKSERSIKIVNVLRTKFSYLLNDMRNFNEVFRNDVNYDNFKSQKSSASPPI